MSVLRVNKTKDYTVMSNRHLKEKDMSLKAKGLLSLMLSLPDNWDYSIAGLVAICKESKTSIQSTLKELECFKYLVRTRTQNNKGQFSYIYDIYEKPQTENQYTDNQCTENVPQLNTKELNTNKSNTKHISKKESKKSFNDLIDEYTGDELLREELKNHLATRKSKKAALTNRAIELSLKNLDKLVCNCPVNNQEAEKLKIVQQSIERGWTGFFPINQSNKQNQNSNTSGNPFFDILREEGKM